MKQRRYHIDAVNDSTGVVDRQTTYPMPHDACCRMIARQSDASKRCGTRFVLKDPLPHEVDHASEPWLSYRMRGRYGWICIGAADVADAMRQAARSTDAPDRAALEAWNGERYVPA